MCRPRPLPPPPPAPSLLLAGTILAARARHTWTTSQQTGKHHHHHHAALSALHRRFSLFSYYRNAGKKSTGVPLPPASQHTKEETLAAGRRKDSSLPSCVPHLTSVAVVASSSPVPAFASSEPPKPLTASCRNSPPMPSAPQKARSEASQWWAKCEDWRAGLAWPRETFPPRARFEHQWRHNNALSLQQTTRT